MNKEGCEYIVGVYRDRDHANFPSYLSPYDSSSNWKGCSKLITKLLGARIVRHENLSPIGAPRAWSYLAKNVPIIQGLITKTCYSCQHNLFSSLLPRLGCIQLQYEEKSQ